MVEDGFRVEGTTYATISSAAKVASGFASVNGYLFWGLIPPAPRAGKAANARRVEHAGA